MTYPCFSHRKSFIILHSLKKWVADLRCRNNEGPLELNIFNHEKHRTLPHNWKDIENIIKNQTKPSLNEGSLVITMTVSIRSILSFHRFNFPRNNFDISRTTNKNICQNNKSSLEPTWDLKLSDLTPTMWIIPPSFMGTANPPLPC